MMIGKKRRMRVAMAATGLVVLGAAAWLMEDGVKPPVEPSGPGQQPQVIARESAGTLRSAEVPPLPSPPPQAQLRELVRLDGELPKTPEFRAPPGEEVEVGRAEPREGRAALGPDEHTGPARADDIRTLIVPALKPATRNLSVQLAAGDTLIEALRRIGVSLQDSIAATGTLSELFDPRRFRAGQSFQVRLSAPEEDVPGLCLDRLQFSPETDRLISLQHSSHTAFAAAESAIEHAPDLALREGSIDTSLFEAAQAAEVPVPVLLETYRVLAHAIDFQRDLRSGDRFAVGYEVFDDGSGRLHEGRLVYAALGAGERNVRVFRYTTSDGFEGFFDESGASIATSLLRTPVDGARLSSLYGKRDHPILNYTRMHRGLDFAAPRGTPVLAAGDGVVVRRERLGSFGNYVRIKHDTSYATAYAHLSGYARGLQQGQRVRQGEVIGYVGATGLATGPNLHFEVLRDDRQVNPMALKLPPRKKLAGEELERFELAKADLRAAFSEGAQDRPEERPAATPTEGASARVAEAGTAQAGQL